MKDYKHIHRPNPYRLPDDDNNLDERILNWGCLIISIVLVVLLITGVID